MGGTRVIGLNLIIPGIAPPAIATLDLQMVASTLKQRWEGIP